mmetsp:Transcript_14406/g.22732  ORF Transcript_14406/g.22732 Transcript_14406/m.22732 type:complete len:261 (+) Transcript_14406:83-865(+)
MEQSSDDEECLGAIGSMFDTEMHKDRQIHNFAGDTYSVITYSIVQENPGALISGQYLWPGASALCNFLLELWGIGSTGTPHFTSEVRALELGAGCGLSGLLCAQLPGVAEVGFTDRDQGALALVQQALDDPEQAPRLRARCWTTPLEWGPSAGGQGGTGPLACSFLLDRTFNLIIGSDVIYTSTVVPLLFSTVDKFLDVAEPQQAIFLMSSSFSYDEETESAIDLVCDEMCLHRKIIRCDLETGGSRIQIFIRKGKEGTT